MNEYRLKKKIVIFLIKSFGKKNIEYVKVKSKEIKKKKLFNLPKIEYHDSY